MQSFCFYFRAAAYLGRSQSGARREESLNLKVEIQLVLFKRLLLFYHHALDINDKKITFATF